jgi:hypothetical protein
MTTQLIPTAQQVVAGDIVRFVYNGLFRRVLVNKVVHGSNGYVQGENLEYDGEMPERRFGTFRFDRMLPNKHGNPGVHIED